MPGAGRRPRAEGHRVVLALSHFTQHAVLPAQPIEFLAFARGQAVATQTVIERGLLNPRADGLGRGLELARQLVDATAGARRLDEAPPLFRRIWSMGS
jgi:hypothetical protein